MGGGKKKSRVSRFLFLCFRRHSWGMHGFYFIGLPQFLPLYFEAFLALIQGFGDTVHTMRTNEFLAYCSSPSPFMTWNEQGFSFRARREGERGRDGRRTQATLTVSPHFPSPFSSSTAVERETSTEKGGRRKIKILAGKGSGIGDCRDGIRQAWNAYQNTTSLFGEFSFFFLNDVAV